MQKFTGAGCDACVEIVKMKEWQLWEVPDCLHFTSLAAYVSHSTTYYEFTQY
jgi:hypothetical protein